MNFGRVAKLSYVRNIAIVSHKKTRSKVSYNWWQYFIFCPHPTHLFQFSDDWTQQNLEFLCKVQGVRF